METKHTPGEWFATREGWSTVYIEARIRPGVLQEVAACGPTEAGREQQEANAQLIAAAPKLLETLSNLVAYLDEHDWGGVPEGATADAARAAIAKATGQPCAT